MKKDYNLLTEEELEEFKDLYFDKLLSIKEISEWFGIDYNNAFNYAHGLKLNKNEYLQKKLEIADFLKKYPRSRYIKKRLDKKARRLKNAYENIK